MAFLAPLFIAAAFLFPSSANVGEHEFYVGLTDIVYNPDTERYEVTIKVFTDDLELGISTSSGKNPRIGGETELAGADALIFDYALERFSLKSPEKDGLSLRIIGRETELDVTWLYFESEKTKPLDYLIVFNSLMMEVYSDQTHIVHLTQGGSTKSTLLHQSAKSGKLKK